MKTTTLNRIQELSPLEENWKALLKGLGKTEADNKPLAYAAILEIWGLDGALWAAGAEPQYNWRLLAISFARRVQHLTSDQRVSDCLDIAERVSLGKATTKNLDAAIMAADEASREASRACLAAPRNAKLESAQESTWAACRAASKVPAWDAARAAAFDAARAAAWDVLRSAHPENMDAVWDAAVWDSAIDAEIKEQKKMFLEFVKNELVAARLAPVEDEELVEIAAREIAFAQGDVESPNSEFMDENWHCWEPEARAAISAIRPHIEAAERERCAKIAETPDLWVTDKPSRGCDDIAAAIRRGE